MKWLRRSVLSLLGLVVLAGAAAGAVLWLIASEAGTAWLAARLLARTGPALTVGRVGGTWLGRLVLEDVRLRLPRDELDKLRFHDPAKHADDFASLSDEELCIVARNRETLALLSWEPYMHNPKLRHRLHRVNAPALFLRGASDGIVSAEYLERYAALVPNARIETIAAAGHLPHVEQPAATAAKVLQFLNG